jgi:amyloid beta precursor protein binding protein 1
MNARILLINAGPTGTETLKNLVLPAVGHFTVLDAKSTDANDCANNFFVTKDHVGKPRAAVVTELLLEMNVDCAGDFRYVML